MTDAVVQVLGQIPPAIYVLVLLAGPTLAWLTYRSMASRRSARSVNGQMRGLAIEAEYWQCPECLSLTPMTRPTCYSCGFEPGRDDVDEVGELREVGEAGERASVLAGMADREQALPRR